MVSVLRAAGIYLILLLIFRATGKRTLAQITTFDYILLLIVAEATQQGLLGDDFSVTNAVVVIGTLVVLDRVLDGLAARYPGFNKTLNNIPVVIVEDGRVVEEAPSRYEISEGEVLQQARLNQGIERLEQIKYAVLERNGGVSVIPKSG